MAVGRWVADGAHLQAELRYCEGRTPRAWGEKMASAVCVAEERLVRPLGSVSQGSTDVAVGLRSRCVL